MANLDSPSEIGTLDSKNLAGSIELLANQCQQVFDEVSKLEFDAKFSSADKIVVMGMGGSTLGADIIHSLYFDHLKASLEVVGGYHIPGYVDPKTLVILSSYSGTTEEVLASCQEAKKVGAMVMAITSGGNLAKLVQSGEVPGYVFDPRFNPSGQPRMGLGYSILSLVLVLSKLGYLNFEEEEFQKILKAIEKINSESKIEVETSNNKAKQVAQKIHGRVPFLLASEHLVGNIHTFANQINENAKTISAYFTLPEADHHLIEGFPSTDEVHENVVFFFLNSQLYSERVKKRYPITQILVEKAGFESVEVEPQGKSKIEQSFEFLTFGSWVSFYLAIIYGRDTSPIPNVDFLKLEMLKG
ncbi:SIS domain-containing protein [Candidatus Curtissbacteria bacterium]|nr:SIS domain-containing protein [Candidatus Curtissbacteria bacterium]